MIVMLKGGLVIGLFNNEVTTPEPAAEPEPTTVTTTKMPPRVRAASNYFNIFFSVLFAVYFMF